MAFLCAFSRDIRKFDHECAPESEKPEALRGIDHRDGTE